MIMNMTLEEAEARREELYKSLTDLNARIAALDDARTRIRHAIKDLEMYVAEAGKVKLVRATPSGLQ